MYTCSLCGFKKQELGGNPEFEFRSRRRQQEDGYLEGISDWCPKCQALRFFLGSDNDTEPLQYLDEQPKRNLANLMLEATSKGMQRNRSTTRAKRNDVDMNPLNQHIQREVAKFLSHATLTALPPHNTRHSLEYPLRSQSEERSRRGNISGGQRSRSMVREPLNKLRQEILQAEHRSCLARTMPKLHALKLEKRVQLDERDGIDSAGQRNDLDDREDEPSVPNRNMRKMPNQKTQQAEREDPWHEEQRRANQLMLSSPNTKVGQVARTRDEGNPNEDLATNRLTLDKVREIEQEMLEEELNQKLLEKTSLVCEWNRIRRRVEVECDRVKAELDELNMELIRSQPDAERQQGGAQLLLPPPTSYSECGYELKRKLSFKVEKADDIGSALDEKLRKMLESLQENSLTTNSPFDQSEEEYEPSAPPASETDFELSETHVETELIPGIQEEDSPLSHEEFNTKQESLCSLRLQERSETLIRQPKRMLSKMNFLVSTVQRATYCSFAQDLQLLLQNLNTTEVLKRGDPPPAQFSTVPCSSNELIDLLNYKREVLEPNIVQPLKPFLAPIVCPHAECGRLLLISDFNDHLTQDHPSLPIERAYPGRPRTFYLDTRCSVVNRARCQMAYFVKDSLKNTSKYSELLPVLVMTARLYIPDFFTHKNLLMQRNKQCIDDSEIYLIWLTSVNPDDKKMIGTIAVWPTNKQPFIEHLTVHTSEVNSILMEHKLMNIFADNRVMALPGNCVNRMTDGGKNLLAVQVLIH